MNDRQPTNDHRADGPGRIDTLLAGMAEADVSPLARRRLETMLAADPSPLMPSDLATRTGATLRSELRSLAARAYRRRVGKGLVVAGVASAVVLTYDAYLLGVLHELLQVSLPRSVATYIVVAQTAALALVTSSICMSVPYVAARTGPRPGVTI